MKCKCGLFDMELKGAWVEQYKVGHTISKCEKITSTHPCSACGGTGKRSNVSDSGIPIKCSRIPALKDRELLSLLKRG